MGSITPIVREVARVRYVEANGQPAVVDVDITGPVVNAAKVLDGVAQIIRKDGGKVTDVKFGTKQAGQFREEKRRKVPAFVNGWRTFSAYLRA